MEVEKGEKHYPSPEIGRKSRSSYLTSWTTTVDPLGPAKPALRANYNYHLNKDPAFISEHTNTQKERGGTSAIVKHFERFEESKCQE